MLSAMDVMEFCALSAALVLLGARHPRRPLASPVKKPSIWEVPLVVLVAQQEYR